MRSRVPLLAVIFRPIFLFALFVCVPVIVARADTVTTFTLTNTAAPEEHEIGDLGGTVMIDTTTGVIESIDLTYSDLPSSGITSYAEVGTGPLVNFGEAWGGISYSYEVAVTIYLPVDTLVGYVGGPICSEYSPCSENGATGPIFSSLYVGDGGCGIGGAACDFEDGDLSTPEPSSFVLLGTGLLGLAGAVRCRRHDIVAG